MLPVVMVRGHEKHIMTKAELEEFGYVGAEEMPDGRCVYKYPVLMARNHYRCMKKAYLKNGLAGINGYIDGIKNMKNLED